MKPVVCVIIPALNEQESIAKVIGDIPSNVVQEVVVVDNGSTDLTFDVATNAGATVLKEPQKGYGYACLKGMDYLGQKVNPDIVVFMDADYSDFPQEIEQLLQPILQTNVDIVIGSRVIGNREKGSLTPQQVFGNWLATKLLRLFYGVKYSDLGPFRAIKWNALQSLNMQDKTYGWTVEMQLKAAKHKLKYAEIPVSYRRRIGVSKVSGTIKGSVLAGYKIITTIFKYL